MLLAQYAQDIAAAENALPESAKSPCAEAYGVLVSVG